MTDDEKPKYLPTDQPGLIRDTESGAILMTDRKALELHRKRRSHQEAQIKSINSLQDEVTMLRTQMAKILAKLDKE